MSSMLIPDTPGKIFRTIGPDEYPMDAVCITGMHPGKTVLVTAQIHSGEYPGTPAVIQAANDIDPDELHGRLIMIPCVNISGFNEETDAYVPEDRGNLNRDYRKGGSTLTGRIAQYFINELFPLCDFVIDLHSGGVYETLAPCVFCPKATEKESLAAAGSLKIPWIVTSYNRDGECGYAAFEKGIPSLLLERGYGGQCLKEWIEDYKEDIYRLLDYLGVLSFEYVQTEHVLMQKAEYPVFMEDGLFYPAIRAGQEICKGQLLGHTEDIRGNLLNRYTAEDDGIVLYYHSGLRASRGTPLGAYALKKHMIKI